jgi:hypothetical protein
MEILEMIIKFIKINKGRHCPTLHDYMAEWPPRIIKRPFMNHLFKGSDGSHRFIKPKNRKMKVVWEE